MHLNTQFHTMADSQLIALCFVLYIVYRILSAIHLLFIHPLSKYPGPKLWAVSRIPWARHVIRGDLWQALDRLHGQYGPVVRIAPDELTTVSPEAWREIYATRPLLPKDPYSQTPPLNGAHSLFTAADETHKRIRAALSNAFSDKALREQSPIFTQHGANVTSRLRRELGRGHSVVDLQKILGYAAFDSISDLTFGKPDQLLAENDLHPTDNDNAIQRFFLHAKFSMVRYALAHFRPLDIVLGLFLLSTTRKSRERNWSNAIERVERRLQTPAPPPPPDSPDANEKEEKRSDFLTRILIPGRVVGQLPRSTKEGSTTTSAITTKELTTNCLAFVIADCQLTTVFLSTALYFLISKPTRWARLAQEIRDTFASEDQITPQSTTTPARPMEYLEAIINETLRVRHPTPINLPRVVTEREGRVIGGVGHVPRGVVVGVNLMNIQTSSTSWGADGHDFDEGRWLDGNNGDGRRKDDTKGAYMPFSTGVRNCIGNKVFLAQARVFLSRLAWGFDLALEEELDDNWLDQKAFLVFEPKPLWVRISERSV